MKALVILLLTAALLTVCYPGMPSAQSVEQTAGIYYAYPGPLGEVNEVPEGFEPVYVSHYGRHGSRWITEDKRYVAVADVFDSAYVESNLTSLGLDVRDRLLAVLDDALGKGGSLSPVGERQHRGIAERMANRCPEVFSGDARVDAVSSTSQRCIMSMAAFCERLKEGNPMLSISRTAYDKDMDYIAYTSPGGKAFSADTAAWRTDFSAFCRETVMPQRLMSSLFVDPSFLTPDEQFDLMMGLYWIASDMQDVEVGEDFYDIFMYDELQAIWRTINARMYLCNADAPLAGGVMKHCADNLLVDIVTKADAALGGNGVAANLRFGHDTHLLRLLALMGIDGTRGQETDMARFHQVWHDYELSPMAANLQLAFYSDADGSTIVRVLLNENEAKLPITEFAPGFYEWWRLREYLCNQLTDHKICTISAN